MDYMQAKHDKVPNPSFRTLDASLPVGARYRTSRVSATDHVPLMCLRPPRLYMYTQSLYTFLPPRCLRSAACTKTIRTKTCHK